ncbi:hypothetical protein K523DRAFT_324000 [Schizophyllum commune Tattone D]|nr:hypothetical protein K523DRAFT_324000 [Schizophyllum commune Tattone D]
MTTLKDIISCLLTTNYSPHTAGVTYASATRLYICVIHARSDGHVALCVEPNARDDFGGY